MGEPIRHPCGFIVAPRSGDGLELIKSYPLAFVLLYVIAMRARYSTSINPLNLQPGEALIGDHRACGMSERAYRTAKKRLQACGIVTFRPTNKGTVARIVSTTIFDVNVPASDEQGDGQATGKRRTSDEQVTTNEQGKKVKKEKTLVDSDHLEALGDQGSAAVAAPSPEHLPDDDEWLGGLCLATAYSGVDVRREFSKMQQWCSVNGKKPTRRRFINWLNRCDRPIGVKDRNDRNAGTANADAIDQYRGVGRVV